MTTTPVNLFPKVRPIQWEILCRRDHFESCWRPVRRCHREGQLTIFFLENLVDGVSGSLPAPFLTTTFRTRSLRRASTSHSARRGDPPMRILHQEFLRRLTTRSFGERAVIDRAQTSERCSLRLSLHRALGPKLAVSACTNYRIRTKYGDRLCRATMEAEG
jgi:hypothetical protein